MDNPVIDLTSDLSSGAFDQGQSGTTITAPAVAAPAVIHDSGPVVAPPGTVPAHTASDELNADGSAKAPVSLRDMLSNAYKGTEAPAADAVVQVPNAHAPGTLESNRHSDGRFKSTEEMAADKVKIDAAAAAAPQQQQSQSGAVRPPAMLSQAEQAAFNALPPEMQQFVARTTASAETHVNSLREYDQLRQVMTPERIQAWAVNGQTPAMAHHTLYALSDFATRSPAQFIAWFAAQNGVDIGKLGEAYVPPDPALTALQTQLHQVQSQLHQVTQGAQDQALNSTISEIERFATATDDKGVALRPYWNELTAEILPFIQAERAQNPNRSPGDILTAAYDRACWGNPGVRAKMQAAADAGRLAELRQQVPAARAAASSVTGAPAGGPNAANDAGSRSLRDELRHNFAAHASAV